MLQKLKSESGILGKKFSSLQKEMEDQRESVRKQQAEVVKLNAVIRDMEKDIVVLKKEIAERDDTIQDKVCMRVPHALCLSGIICPPNFSDILNSGLVSVLLFVALCEML